MADFRMNLYEDRRSLHSGEEGIANLFALD